MERLQTFWSCQKVISIFRIPDLKSICAFGPDNSIIGIIYLNNSLVISADGKYYQASFDQKNGGECTKVQETSLNIGADS